VFAAEHLSRLGELDIALKIVEALQQIRFDRLARLGPLDEDAEIVAATRQGFSERQFVFDAAAPLKELLRLCLIFPEVWFGDAGLDAVELGARTGRVKDSSADRKSVSPDPGSAAPARRERTS
jgi:hypothetical protein